MSALKSEPGRYLLRSCHARARIARKRIAHADQPVRFLMPRYTGGDGIYTLTTRYERDPDCLECSAAVVFEVRADMTLQEARLQSVPSFQQLAEPPCRVLRGLLAV